LENDQWTQYSFYTSEEEKKRECDRYDMLVMWYEKIDREKWGVKWWNQITSCTLFVLPSSCPNPTAEN